MTKEQQQAFEMAIKTLEKLKESINTDKTCMKNTEKSNLKTIKTQTEYEETLKDKRFVKETINLTQDRILRLSKEIAKEYNYLHNYETILEDLDELVLRWEIEQEITNK